MLTVLSLFRGSDSLALKGGMMLTEIKKLKGFGVFSDYAATAEVKPFKRYNVVYGENGSGKTTLSRLLGCLEAGVHLDHPDLEFTIESQSGPLTRGSNYGRKVRVFNSDYVEANIGRLDGPLRHILILGEKNKAIADEMEAEIKMRDQRVKRIEDITASSTKLEIDKGKVFSGIARMISEATSGAQVRNYRKNNAEAAFANLTTTTLLSDDELQAHHTTVRQEQMASVGLVAVPSVVHDDNAYDLIELALGSSLRAKSLALRTAQSATIARLKQNPDIAQWVEAGVQHHADHESTHCEFCAQMLPAERMQALAEHFSIEDQLLKGEIESERDLIAFAIDALGLFELPDRLAFYSEIRDEYDAAREGFTNAIAEVGNQLGGVHEALGEKLKQRTLAYDPQLVVNADPLSLFLVNIAAIIARHNDKTAEFDNAKRSASGAIEAHYLLSVKAQVDDLTAKVTALLKESTLLVDGGPGLPDARSLEALNQSIVDKKALVSDEHAGGAGLTDLLRQFLGRTDLRFDSGAEGYQVMRRGKPAKRLSEGEKTAIAFLYFLVQLKDQDFDIQEGIVVIDDPISSLDASSIYQAFSFLKNASQQAKQLFVLTHNFEFLKLLISWLTRLPNALKKDCSYTMVLCAEDANGRSARLAPLDQLLIDHATEYHYLFKILYTFKSDGTIQQCYHIPNIARKVLDTFLDFYIPSNDTPHRKLEAVAFDQHKKTAILKFANDQSHHTGKGFDPAIVAETQKNTSYLLDMIKTVAPKHYEGLRVLSEA